MITQMDPPTHHSPATVGGESAQHLSKRLSTALTDVYYRGKQRSNAIVETHLYAPEGQTFDAMWSGSSLDSLYRNNESKQLINRVGLTREERAKIDGKFEIRDANAVPVFMEGTRSKIRGSEDEGSR